MKILHIWDICDNSAFISSKLNAMGHKSFVVQRFILHMGGGIAKVRLRRYILNVIYHLLAFRSDIIHINTWDKVILLARLLSPRSKIIMHYHGSDIRNKQIPITVQLCADLVCFSTRDLIDAHAPFPSKLLPVLISDDFYYHGGREKGVIIEIPIDNRNIPYELMPFILSLGEYYRDKKRIKITSSRILSKTGMEALVCGTKVITDSGEVVESFPMANLKDYYLLYNEMCC